MRAAAVCAWLLASVEAATGIGKLLDVAGFARVLAGYRLLPAPLLLPVAWGVTLAELAVAAGLVLRRWRRPAAAAAAALAVLDAAVLTITLLRGIPLDNCGCFGVFLARPLRPYTPLEDVAMLAAALLVLAATPGRRPAAVPARPTEEPPG